MFQICQYEYSNNYDLFFIPGIHAYAAHLLLIPFSKYNSMSEVYVTNLVYFLSFKTNANTYKEACANLSAFLGWCANIALLIKTDQ